MHETENVNNETRTDGHTSTGNTATIGRVLDITVVAFVMFTLVLMPILSAGANTKTNQGDAGSFSAQEREALVESRGDAAESAAAENAAAEDSGNEARMVRGADGNPVDRQTREAIDQASRGDAAARGSVASDYDDAGGRN